MTEKMFLKTGLCLAAALVLVLGGRFAVAGPQEAISIVPHKALYDIKMVTRHSGAQVLNIKGQMSFEWRQGCDAWTTDHRFRLRYDYADSPPMDVISDFSTYETLDGKSLIFTSRRQRNGEVYEEMRGRAGDGKVAYSIPEGVSYDIPAETLFPMAHTVQLLQQIKRGKNFFNAVIFDGSDDEGPVEINAFVGKPVNAMAFIKPAPELNAELLNTPAHNVRMAFFPLSQDEAESDYEMNVVLHDNGIISDMLVEYDDFSVTQKLVAVERLPGEKCPDSPPGAQNKGNKKSRWPWRNNHKK